MEQSMVNHPNRKRVEPSRIVRDVARAALLKLGEPPTQAVRLAWEIPGPKDTEIAWLSCYFIGAGICIVETFRDGGWNAFTPCDSIEVEATLADVLNRCGVPAPVAA
jgi:hypothetical protein